MPVVIRQGSPAVWTSIVYISNYVNKTILFGFGYCWSGAAEHTVSWMMGKITSLLASAVQGDGFGINMKGWQFAAPDDRPSLPNQSKQRGRRGGAAPALINTVPSSLAPVIDTYRWQLKVEGTLEVSRGPEVAHEYFQQHQCLRI